MRDAYQEQMVALNALLGEMCDTVGREMESATQALLDADLERAEQVISDHDGFAARSAEAEEIFASFDPNILRRFFAFLKPHKTYLILAQVAVLASAATAMSKKSRSIRWSW